MGIEDFEILTQLLSVLVSEFFLSPISWGIIQTIKFMHEFQQKQKIRRILYSRSSLIVAVIVTTFFLRGAWGVWQKQKESRAKLAETEVALVVAQNRQAVLSQNIERLNTTEGMEREIRERFSVKKPGEDVILVVESPEATTSITVESQSVWSKIELWFAGFFKR